MREVLIISDNDDLSRWMRWSLEDLGFAVRLSRSLENSFLEAHGSPFMVIVDSEAIPEECWQAKEYLAWFHRRSPVLLLANPDGCEQLQEECDRCLPQAVGREQFLNCFRELGRF